MNDYIQSIRDVRLTDNIQINHNKLPSNNLTGSNMKTSIARQRICQHPKSQALDAPLWHPAPYTQFHNRFRKRTLQPLHFYSLDTKIVWNNVFYNSLDGILDDYFCSLGTTLYDFLSETKDLSFRLTPEPQDDFNATFDRLQIEYPSFAVILSALCIQENGNFEDDPVCLDRNFATARTIAPTLIRHNATVFLDLPQAPSQSAPAAKGSARNRLHKDFFAALPQDFDRKTYQNTATQVGLNPSTSDRLIRKWCEERKLENTSHGKYHKLL